ncbi:HAD family phosphatase [Arthrobacter tecti]
MIRSDTAQTWYLFDYGMVICTAPEPSDWALLEGATGLDLQPVTSAYWIHRELFDAGELSPAEYWSRVVGRRISDQLVDKLEALDAAQWSHLNAATMSVLEAMQIRGCNLALLSNMPVGMSDRFVAASPWIGYFSRRFFSGQLGMTKPDVRIFEHVLAELPAQPGQIVFIDDNAANIETATTLGFRTVRHTGETDLRNELLG